MTKNKVGYRLREILSGKTEVLREKDAYGNWISTKAYEFNLDKLKKIAKKYGFEVVTKLLTLPSSEGMQAPESMEKSEENNVGKERHTPQQLSKLGNLVTSEIESSNLPIQDSATIEPIPSTSSKNLEYENTMGKRLSNSVMTFQEVLEKLRFVFVEGTEEEWIGLAVEAGLSEGDAKALFESLKGKDKRAWVLKKYEALTKLGLPRASAVELLSQYSGYNKFHIWKILRVANATEGADSELVSQIPLSNEDIARIEKELC